MRAMEDREYAYLKLKEGNVSTLSVRRIFLLKNRTTLPPAAAVRLSIPPSTTQKKLLGEINISPRKFLRAMEESNPHQKFWKLSFYH